MFLRVLSGNANTGEPGGGGEVIEKSSTLNGKVRNSMANLSHVVVHDIK